jgi:hypothetical protein
MRGEKKGKESMWLLLKKSFIFDIFRWFSPDDFKHILIDNQIVKRWNLKFNDGEREKTSWRVRREEKKKVKKVCTHQSFVFDTEIISTR